MTTVVSQSWQIHGVVLFKGRGTLWAFADFGPRTLLLVAMFRLHCSVGVSVCICGARWK